MFVTPQVVILVSVLYTLFPLGESCGPSEYESSTGECCPMCNIGLVVYRDCSGDLSTTCIPCSQGLFMDKPNGFRNCFPCRQCSESEGLYIQSLCTTIKDTVCGVLDGYHCIDNTNSKCEHAEKNSVCQPGQEIKTPGTKISDTVCEDCPLGFYSPAGVNCTKWTDCAVENEIESEAGSSIKDVTCTQKEYGKYIVVVLTSITVFITVITAIIFYKRQQIKQHITSCILTHPTEETASYIGNEGCHPSTIYPMPVEDMEDETTVFTSTDHKKTKSS